MDTNTHRRLNKNRNTIKYVDGDGNVWTITPDGAILDLNYGEMPKDLYGTIIE